MKPLQHFDAVWNRADQLSAIHAYVASNVTGALNPDELLRAEWVFRLSALDLYIHELVAQSMVLIFEGSRTTTPAYLRFKVSAETLNRIQNATSKTDATAAFDLEVRNQLSLLTYQDPERIAEGVRLCSEIELWNEVAAALGASPGDKTDEAKKLRRQLSLIVRRRNQIAHEGDLQPTLLREPWPITQVDVTSVRELIEKIVKAIDTSV